MVTLVAGRMAAPPRARLDVTSTLPLPLPLPLPLRSPHPRMRALARPRLLALLPALSSALVLAWLLLAAVCPAPARAQDLLPVPPLSGRVVDQTATLSAADAAALDAKLAAFEAQAGPQIVLLLVPATAPEDIASYAQRVADAWKIGRRAVGDGVLLVVAKDERKLRIEVAKALEGAIPDLAARQIIDSALRPALRNNDFAGGLNAAVDQLIARIRGENLPAPEAQSAPAARQGAKPGLQLDELALFFFLGVPIVGAFITRIVGRRLGALVTAGAAGGAGWWLTASVLAGVGAGIVALLLVGVFGIGSALRNGGAFGGRRGGLSNIGGWAGGLGGLGGLGGGGWGGGGGGGGGFSSGGGGDFGGGGASGDW